MSNFNVHFTLLKTSPEYTRAGIYGKFTCVKIAISDCLQWVN